MGLRWMYLSLEENLTRYWPGLVVGIDEYLPNVHEFFEGLVKKWRLHVCL